MKLKTVKLHATVSEVHLEALERRMEATGARTISEVLRHLIEASCKAEVQAARSARLMRTSGIDPRAEPVRYTSRAKFAQARAKAEAIAAFKAAQRDEAEFALRHGSPAADQKPRTWPIVEDCFLQRAGLALCLYYRRREGDNRSKIAVKLWHNANDAIIDGELDDSSEAALLASALRSAQKSGHLREAAARGGIDLNRPLLWPQDEEASHG